MMRYYRIFLNYETVKAIDAQEKTTLVMSLAGLLAFSLFSMADTALAQSPGEGQSRAQDGGQADTGAQTSAETKTMYKPAYPMAKASASAVFIVQTDKHLYKPGEDVTV